jgi:PTH1 family peptidyl-tRNA hydrolase
MNLFLGLGNPGVKYALTRHNVGHECIGRFSDHVQIPLDDKRRTAVLGIGQVEQNPVTLVRSRTFMNESGSTAAYIVRRFKASPRDLLIIYDDLDLPLGKIRIRGQGSSGGHKGMQSVIDALGSKDIPRIRVGIGRSSKEAEIPHVLGAFEDKQKPIIQEAISRVSDALLVIITHGLDEAMNRYN